MGGAPRFNAAVTASPPHCSPPRRFPGRRLSAAALLSLSVLALSACNDADQTQSTQTNSSSSSTSNDGSITEQNSYTISDKIAQLRLESRAGTVSVVAADGPISVTEKLQYTDSKPTTSHDVAGDVLSLRSEGCPNQRPVNSRCEVDWEIRAPAGTNLDLDNKAGGITVTGMSGTVLAKTNAGGVDGHRLISKIVTAQSQAGGVELEFREPPNQVDTSSNAGGIEIQLPSGSSYAIQADTNTGDPEIEVQQDQNSPHKIKAKNQAGGVEITNG